MRNTFDQGQMDDGGQSCQNMYVMNLKCYKGLSAS